jgi:hypothetical protein
VVLVELAIYLMVALEQLEHYQHQQAVAQAVVQVTQAQVPMLQALTVAMAVQVVAVVVLLFMAEPLVQAAMELFIYTTKEKTNGNICNDER